MSNERVKYDYIYFLNVIAMLGVVVFHMINMFYGYQPVFSWYLRVVITECLIFHVPVFFMISGANLLTYRDRSESSLTYLKKRVLKTLIPFLFWSTICAFLYDFPTLNSFLCRRDFSRLFLYLIKGTFTYQFNLSYWFFLNLFINYIFIIFLSLVPVDKRNYIYLIIIIVLFIFFHFLPFLSKCGLIEYKFVHYGFFCLIYVLVGYLINTYYFNRFIRIIIYFFGLVSVVIAIMFTIKSSKSIGVENMIWSERCCPTNVFYSVAVFTFFKYSCPKFLKGKFKQFIVFLASYSFPVYLLHMIILQKILPLIGIDSLTSNVNHYIIDPIALLLTIIISIFIAFIFRKLPILKRFLP